MITVLCGGVGAARFLRALCPEVGDEQVSAVVNTADDTVLHGLHISPDLDTVVYTLAGAIDPERGWGLRDETWRAMGALGRYAEVRPASSSAGANWFNLGDQDLATHCYRTARLAEGASLSEISAEIARAWGLAVDVVPMSDDPVRTRVTLAADGRTIGFQEYFVRERHSVPVAELHFDGATTATLAPGAAAAIDDARVIVVAPSNPLVSIGPIRALATVDERLMARRDTVVAVSPIVGGAALKGPADRMMIELGHEPSVVGVARLYAPIASVLVIDPADAHLADQVASAGMRPVVCPSVMADPHVAAHLARTTIAAVSD